MKKKVSWLFITAFITVVAISIAFFIDKVTVTASNSALLDQGWHANFSTPLKKDALGSNDLYIADRNGKQVTADVTLGNAGNTLYVKGLVPGSYTLHVKKNAFKGRVLKSLPMDKVKFTVHETIESVASAKELKAYFERANKMQQSDQTVTMEMEDATSSNSAKSESAKSSGSDHSTTNNQVEGVDEADSVKTDGNYIYSVMGNNKVTITDIRDPKKIQKTSEIKMEEEFYPSQLFLHGDTLIVLGEKYEPYNNEESTSEARTSRPMNGMTTVRMYTVKNPKTPKLIREIGAEGYLNGARKTGNMLYFVTNVQPNFWIMNEIDGDTLRPHVYDSIEGPDSELIDYKDISILPGAMEPTYSVISAIDLSSPAEGKVVTKGYLGASEQLYMSEKNLYLAATIYETNTSISNKMSWNPGTANSELFKFTLNKTNVTFQNSATLKGHLLNQFSMDEHNGYFRVVTTEGNMWDDKKPSKNHLFILDENLNTTGSVEGLAKGERIYSARFIGDKAYMVTFRETDPLFVIDVADPTAPKVLGELKIPGFSNYLHPLDENHLIGFGYETVAEKNPQGGEPLILTMGMKVSLFDVTDFNNPKETDTEIIGGRGTYSPVQYDHKALFQHKERNLYGFPVSVYDEIGKDHNIDFQSSGALVYEITPEHGIVLKGDLLKAKSRGEQYGDWEREIQRMLYSKDILYTVSMKEIKNYSLDTYAPIGNLQID
ncbi:beta-propeller domain-containing protein [Sporosarcina sp. E16_8]|uniref:beta-propeller domain-containing protein n=1 Tax=Sporosarcina sp. E16_8 TaxID=2789295 RepID=UPI001A925834|nr:beta-propeller domain-containing protein [Sporosarcina sp. E16_8]MBO0586808.1 beta-propeller domain-containing protein [Sporosarcina sp. E16_8]